MTILKQMNSSPLMCEMMDVEANCSAISDRREIRSGWIRNFPTRTLVLFNVFQNVEIAKMHVCP